MLQDYAVSRWGQGYFDISEAGHALALPSRDPALPVDLHRLAFELKEAGLSWPVLVRFADILKDRAGALVRAFDRAIVEACYEGRYTAVYPVKVNQQHSVIAEILASGDGRVGLEAGSKSELMAVLAMTKARDGVIVCNGYKDREYIHLALIGRRLGLRVYIVIEKPSEVALIREQAEMLGVQPLLGVRVRLSSAAIGKWQNSGGDKAKFGLSAAQLLVMIQQLKEAGLLSSLQLLHSHIGSQIPNIHDLRKGVAETTRCYLELRQLGAPIEVVDLGGGLGVDYEGTGSRNFCSVNYRLDDYARALVTTLAAGCREHELPQPHIMTESGRALTAHHAVLITNLIEIESPPGSQPLPAMNPEAPLPVQQLWDIHRELEHITPLEAYQEAREALGEIQALFVAGNVSLAERADAELVFYHICRHLLGRLQGHVRTHREILDEVRERLADKLFVNLSLFQSLPDIWAIDQIFPVMPLQRLKETPQRQGILHDLTCDSDGCIRDYVTSDGVERTLPFHDPQSGEAYLFGIFLVGAYQEILGDLHNLFGDTDTVDIYLNPNSDPEESSYRVVHAEHGDSVDEILSYVHFDSKTMVAAYRRKISAAGIRGAEAERMLAALKAGLYGYTYLED